MDRRPRFRRIAITSLVPAVALFIGLGMASTATASTSPAAQAAAVARAAIKNITAENPHSPTLKVHSRSTGIKGLSQVVSGNWSGYADTGSSFSHVAASWTEPTAASCSRRTTSLAAFWVGIDGYSSSSVEQDGTLIECYEGTAYYYDWWEIYPENDVQVVNDVNPGDSISAVVTRSGSSYTMAVTDSTHSGDSFSTTQSYSGAADSSAEWIAEAPSGSSGVEPLTDFGTWNDTGSAVTEGSTAGTISSFTDDEITMESSSGAVEAQPGSLNSSGNAFSVAWKSS
jgi:Peptidase A4 family